MTGPLLLLRGDARNLPLPDASVDLIVTSPPYFALRSYSDNGGHMAGQLGDEPTPAEFVDSLIACTREMMRVLKPAGSIFVNLGDTYSAGFESTPRDTIGSSDGLTGRAERGRRRKVSIPAKSLMMIPERYRIACVDELGLVARAVIVWDKPNGMPESVTDRVRRSHEDWVHLTMTRHYFAALDEIREPHAQPDRIRSDVFGGRSANTGIRHDGAGVYDGPTTDLGRVPGSVWTIATQPLQVPADVEVDHYAAMPMEWPRRLIRGWSPRDVCTMCGEGRRPVVDQGESSWARRRADGDPMRYGMSSTSGLNRSLSDPVDRSAGGLGARATRRLTGYACACPDISAPSTPGVVLDPFGGTGTTALVASMHGRVGISVDLSADYNRLARWRTADPKERARAAGFEAAVVSKIVRPMRDQLDLFEEQA